MRRFALIISMLLLLAPVALRGQQAMGEERDSTVTRLIEAGFMNVRAVQTDEFKVYTIENDSYKLPAEGFARARRIIEGSGLDGDKPVKVIGMYYDVPQVTMTYNPELGSWKTTSRLDAGWNAVRKVKKSNSSFGKVNLVVYPQVSLMNLIINQVYQSLWQVSPALEVSLWPGMKFTYQVKFPIFNDGYGELESMVHPGMVSVSQRFRDPWNLNVLGKMTFGVFSGNRYGAALEMAYIFPNERFSLDTQMGMLGNCYWNGFVLHYDKRMNFRWNLAMNYYCPMLGTQFTLRAQQFLLGEYGVKYEMIRHFSHCSIGLYAEKVPDVQMNVGFRFQIALPPYHMRRRGYLPKVTTSSQMGMTYNANNERTYYQEYRTEASDNIMSNNYFNPYYIDSEISKN